jgi:hypothetical protein
MGDVIPNRTPPASQEKPEAKPFAHFVAGGYVFPIPIGIHPNWKIIDWEV